VGRDVLIVEDIIDTGLTLRFLVRWLETHEPSSIKVCTLLDRPHRRLADVDIAYRGFTVPDRFLVGYGFDYQQSFRQVPNLCELAVGSADAVATEQVHPSW
jgi:hypoxanthine phosphoribosyltransferase